jgi:outer membrane protein TolC
MTEIAVMKIRFNQVFVIAVTVIFFTSCSSEDAYRRERVIKADKHFENIAGRVIEKGKVFQLPECIELALKNNLDLQVSELKEKIANERVTAEILGMLPDLTVTNDYKARNNVPGSSSKSLVTGGATYGYSQSQDQDGNEFKVELLFSALDFGLAYLNVVQAQDRTLIEKQQTQRAAQNLRLDVAKAYFRVAAIQDAIETTEKLLEECRNIDSAFMELSKTKDVSLLRLLDEHKRFIRMQQRLMDFRRSYLNSCIELRTLMGFSPFGEIHVDSSVLAKLSDIDLPEIDLLEKISLTERPELFNLDIQANITLNESRKVILMMFPNVQMVGDFNNSSNSFLLHTSWWEIGVRAAYNVLKLPQHIARYRALNGEMTEIEMQTLSMTIGVMAQVRISQAEMQEAKERYELDEKVYQIYYQHLEYALGSFTLGGALSQLEIDRMKMETAEAQIQRTQALGTYYVAYYRLMNATGLSSMDPETIKKLKEKIEKSESADLTPLQKKQENLELRDLKDDMKTIEAQDKKDFSQPLGLEPPGSK